MEYKIIYSKIKNVYIQIKDGEIIVKAPRRVSKKEIDKMVKSKKDCKNNLYVILNYTIVDGTP